MVWVEKRVSPLRRDGAPPSVEMTELVVRNGERSCCHPNGQRPPIGDPGFARCHISESRYGALGHN
jgi:hypothetical protein